MGFVYAQNSIVSIIAMNDGLTKEEIFEINKRTYRANLAGHWNLIMGLKWIEDFIYEKEGKFYINPEIRENIKTHSRLLNIINPKERKKSLIEKV